jgi:hypothetical protein
LKVSLILWLLLTTRVIKIETWYTNAPSIIRSNDKGVIAMFFNTWTSELLIITRGFWTTKRDDNNANSTREEVKASIGSRLASRGSIGFVAFFLTRLSLHNKACYFMNSARVFALTRRTRFSEVSFKGASLAKRLD